MTLLQTAASGYFAYNFFNISKSFNKTNFIAEKLNAFPSRKTAYKIGILCIQAGFFWMGANSLAVCGGSIYSMITGEAVLAASSLFMKSLVASNALGLGTLVIALPFVLYARAWQLH